MDNVILFYGENTYLMNEKYMTWCDQFEKKHGDLNLIILEGKNLKSAEIYEQSNQLPFLSEKKLVVVKHFLENKSDHQKEFLDYIEKIAEFTVLIFLETNMPDKRLSLFKYLKKNCRVEEFNNLEGALLYNWVSKEADKRGSKIDYMTAKYLTEVAGTNMNELSQEIEKLSLYKLRSEIQKSDIDLLTSAKLSHDVFKLTDAIATKNPKKALEIFTLLTQFNQEVPMIFHMIVRQFRILLQIRDCIDKNYSLSDTQKRIKEHPFVIKNGYSQAKNFTQKELKSIFESLLKIEKDFKTGHIKISVNDHSEFELALEKLIITHC